MIFNTETTQSTEPDMKKSAGRLRCRLTFSRPPIFSVLSASSVFNQNLP
jgi:hypothetical protein